MKKKEHKVILNNFNDYQNMLLAKISYLDIDLKKFERLRLQKGEVFVKDLMFCLKNPDRMYLGDINILGNIGSRLSKRDEQEALAKVKQTDAELLLEIERAGMGNLKIISVEQGSLSGLEAICFEDENETRGFSFRGTDLKSISSLLNDVRTDVVSYFDGGKTFQIRDAKKMFEKYGNKDGKNRLYGHSLGGNIIENIYAKYYDSVEHVFSVNPFHIDPSILEYDDKIREAFNNPKYECVVTGGDVISMLNKDTLYKDRVRYIINNGIKDEKTKLIFAHITECAKYDEYGNLVETTREIAYDGFENESVNAAIEIISKIKDRGIDVIKIGRRLKDDYSNSQKENDSIWDKFKSKILKMVREVKDKLSIKRSENEYTVMRVDRTKRTFDDSLLLENWDDIDTFRGEKIERKSKLLERKKEEYVIE